MIILQVIVDRRIKDIRGLLYYILFISESPRGLLWFVQLVPSVAFVHTRGTYSRPRGDWVGILVLRITSTKSRSARAGTPPLPSHHQAIALEARFPFLPFDRDLSSRLLRLLLGGLRLLRGRICRTNAKGSQCVPQ